MRIATFVASLLLLAACGPAKAPPNPGPDPGPHSANADACAGTYAEVPTGAACTDVDLACTYAEGRCHCGPRSYCGGVAPPQDLLDELAKPTWQCTPVRTDGCPEVTPSGACDQPGQVCSYGDCCFVQLTCQGGAWTETGGGCPP